ncbi:Oidioi.mRNA.OKI2018_I69.PAR.g9666.t1.cds [Oikopleura dioica]|uniref:Oidioi.mRNA.OKI2018_I69.PAR.g9666.t1.cds n=1 Tax=Oikopleura dioica TaxID=34765 RepID=A0ABN7RLU2_OIKDI|nr:Oidioi.mRNA.OKI2018_I69.PAR.g9666.t1.cds [Oikopleura dioica]
MSVSEQHCKPYPISPEPGRHSGFGDGCFSKGRAKTFFNFVNSVNFKVLWGVNAMEGRTQTGSTNWTGDWNSTQFHHMLEDWIEEGYMKNIFAFELGNEIYGQYGIEAKLTVDEGVDTFAELWRVLKESFFSSIDRPKVFGVDTALDIAWVKEFLAKMKIKDPTFQLDAFTYHSYPLGAGSSDKVDEEIMDENFNSKIYHLANQASSFDNLPLGVWMGETGGAYNSGRNTVTNRFMSAFWYVDWMAVMAESGHKAFCRQTFVGGNYGLLQVDSNSKKMLVNPDFYGALLFKELMVGKIYKAWNDKGNSTHQYFAETETINGKLQKTLLVINYSHEPILFYCDEFEDFKSATKYHLTSPNLQSSTVMINGIEAQFKPGALRFNIADYAELVGDEKLEISGHSYVFITQATSNKK